MKVICVVAVCLVLACSVQDASSLGWNDFSSYWFPYYWRTQTTSVTSYSMCGAVRFDTVRHVCCSGRVLPRLDGCKCCGRTTYQVTERMCCEGTITYRLYGYNSCCGGRGYNSYTYRCCRGVIISRLSTCF
ncbi:hypothetical protein NP493_868g02017 [Ridgeia piscesae]|uniref:Galaxin-like repeats domain-containing protein n=1 Tax=Ridgeia piscesae TaxID=27915 RepID=A0AAD9KLK3_RIDPI|nr:hypothetical protein NP493_868g02017 [Ridgeia piscesae]